MTCHHYPLSVVEDCKLSVVILPTPLSGLVCRLQVALISTSVIQERMDLTQDGPIPPLLPAAFFNTSPITNKESPKHHQIMVCQTTTTTIMVLHYHSLNHLVPELPPPPSSMSTSQGRPKYKAGTGQHFSRTSATCSRVRFSALALSITAWYSGQHCEHCMRVLRAPTYSSKVNLVCWAATRAMFSTATLISPFGRVTHLTSFSLPSYLALARPSIDACGYTRSV